MKSSILALAATLALVEAQASLNPNGTFTCEMANGTYCVSDSLQSPLIVRCLNGVGQVGNCNDNVAGEFPSEGFATCWASSPISGIAACAKDCVVYGGSGDSGTFILPGCIPSVTASVATATASSGSIINSYNGTTTLKTTVAASSGTGLPSYPLTGIVPFPTNGTSIVHSSGSGGMPTSATGESSGSSATATPKSPPSSTVTAVPTFTGAAGTMKAGSAIAAVGFFFAAFL